MGGFSSLLDLFTAGFNCTNFHHNVYVSSSGSCLVSLVSPQQCVAEDEVVVRRTVFLQRPLKRGKSPSTRRTTNKRKWRLSTIRCRATRSLRKLRPNLRKRRRIRLPFRRRRRRHRRRRNRRPRRRNRRKTPAKEEEPAAAPEQPFDLRRRNPSAWTNWTSICPTRDPSASV